MRVLVVDGDRRVRAALAALIETSFPAAVCATASRPPIAVQAQRERYDFILIDVPPAQPGPALAAIRSLTEQATTVIAISITASLHTLSRDAGAAAFLTKGEPPEQVIRTINSRKQHRRDGP